MRLRGRSGGLTGWVAAAVLLCGVWGAAAQTPVILPNTISTVGFNVPSAATTAGSVCPTNAQFKATDAYGDGCPAVSALFNTGDADTGITTDALGNVYVSNNTNNPQIIRKIDAASGIISIVTGAQAVSCSGGVTINGTTYTPVDKHGDGCPAAYAGQFNNIAGLGSDPYGNIFFTGLGDNLVHVVCQAVSPLCTAAAARVNLVMVVAGCTSGGSNSGTATTGITPGTAGDGNAAAQTSSCTAGVSAPGPGITADAWDNVYFLDQTGGTSPRYRVVAGPSSVTISGTATTNPLYAALTAAGYTGATGNIYPMVGGNTVAQTASACSGETDVVGDNCLFTQTALGTSTKAQGVVIDNEGDFIYTDGYSTKQGLHVVYMGGAVVKLALAANGVSSPTVGTTYELLGTTGSTAGAFVYYNSGNPGIVKGNTKDLQNNIAMRLAKDAAGNIYIGDQIQILFYDIATGYFRRIATTNGAAVCSGANTVGDGCPITQSFFGKTNTALGLAFDPQGNLFIDDTNYKFVRKVTASSLPATAVNGTQVSSLIVHSPLAATMTITGATSSEYSFGTKNCTSNTTSDSSVECTVAVTFKPLEVGRRSDPLTVAITVSGTTKTQMDELYANSTGSAEVFDISGTPTTSNFGTGATGNTAVVVDGDGNTYVSGTQGISKVVGSTVTNITGTAAKYIAVDPAGNVYGAATTGSTIAKYTYSAGSYTASTITLPSVDIGGTSALVTSGPIAVDANGTIYLIDSTSKQLVRFNQITGVLDSATREAQQITQTAFASPSAISQDFYGNLLVIDGTNIYKIPSAGFFFSGTAAASSGISAYPTANPAVTFSTAITGPTSVTSDPGGDIYVAVSGGGIVVVSASGAYQYTIPNFTGTSIAADGNGNIFATTSTVAGISLLQRNAQSNAFGTSTTTPITGVFLNAGTLAATGFAQSDASADFVAATPSTPLAPAGAPVCNLTTTALTFGGLCNTQLNFTGGAAGTGPVTDAITFTAAATTIGNLTLTGTKTGANATTTTTITGNTTGLVYAASPTTETTFTVTVSQSSGGAPTGNVTVQIDGSNSVLSTGNCTVSSAGTATCALTAATATTSTATVTVTGLGAGSGQTISAAFPGAAGIGASSSGNTTFTIAQAATASSYASPGATTQQYSAAIGTSVFNATATTATGSVLGTFVYTTGGVEINAATYLARGTYNILATFNPTDTVDYATSTATYSGYTVTQASTTAALGATQNLVASSGGNYTSVQAAINSLSATAGGNVYIAPGTYTGTFSVVAPNVSLRGLGGDPTAIVLTHSFGAFSAGTGGSAYAGEFQVGGENQIYVAAGTVASGDEGSATLVVAKGGVAGYNGTTTSALTSTTPTGFYAENFTIANTFNTDNVTTTTTYIPAAGTNCTAGNATALSYFALYSATNSSTQPTECASQALAIWVTSDLAVFNNVYFTGGQDTIYAGTGSNSNTGPNATRQFYFRGKVTGNIDYIFGDAAAVFDHTSIYTTYHRNQTGNATIGAQNKYVQMGSTNPVDYVSGYIFNSDVFTSQSSGMTGLYFARPYGTYSTQVILNSSIDQVNMLGYEEFTGYTNLPTSTYAEYMDSAYTDPNNGSPDSNGVIFLGASGSNTGQGVIVNGSTVVRETTSLNPGTIEVATNSGFQTKYPSLPNTTLSSAEAQQYYPIAFLGKTVSSSSTPNWNPTSTIATNANNFVNGGVTSVGFGQTVTILMRPQTPGLGAITNGSYTIPSGTWSLLDNGVQVANGSGMLDATGEAYYTTSTLASGTHAFTWVYGGDAAGNFAGSTTASAFNLTVGADASTTTLTPATQNIIYGQSATVTVTVAANASTYVPTGNVTLSVDSGASTQTQALASGSYTFTISGLTAGTHTFSASYAGDSLANSSTSVGTVSATVAKAALTVTGMGTNRKFNVANVISVAVTGYQYTDSATTVLATGPTVSTTATRDSVAGTYSVVAAATLTTFGGNNYTLSLVNGSFTVSGPVPQSILFSALPNFPHGGSYQLTARTTSGLPVAYTVTSGSATISGATLTVTGTGMVTVQAFTNADPHNDYGLAMPVSQSFTAP